MFETLYLWWVFKLPRNRWKKFSRTLSWRFTCAQIFLFSSPLVKLILKHLFNPNSNWVSNSCKKLSVSMKAYYKCQLCFLWLELHKRFATHIAPYGPLQYRKIEKLIIYVIFYNSIKIKLDMKKCTISARLTKIKIRTIKRNTNKKYLHPIKNFPHFLILNT